MYEGDRRFQELADALAEPVCVVRPDGRLLHGNRKWHLLTKIGEGDDFPGRFLEMIHPEDRPRWIDSWGRAMRSRNAYEIERRVRFAPDDDYISQLEHGHPVRDSSGGVVEWVLIATASDENQRLVENLRRSLRRKEEFLVAVAHEMRNPLVPIANAMTLLERSSSDPRLVMNACALISRQVARLARLVDDLLDLERLEHCQLQVRRDSIDLREVLTAAAEMAQPLIAERGHLLTIAVPAHAARVHGDEGRLTQVVANLLINAAKFTDEDGRIVLSLEKDEHWIRVSVRDTGIGISREMLPTIFEAYVQVEHGAGRTRSGLGLGLALARQLAQLHGGTLTAHSEGVGKGSEFVLHLPAAHTAPIGQQTTEIWRNLRHQA